jgi:hypothetical protein
MFLLRGLVSENALQHEKLWLLGSEVGGLLGNACYSRASALEGIGTTDFTLNQIIHVNDSRKCPNRHEINSVDQHRCSTTYTTTYFMIISI